MQELLKAQYGDGYHVKALCDIYEDRKYSQAISISTNIVQPEYTKDHQKQAWENISVSLNTAFKNTTTDITQTSMDVIVKSGVNAPPYLDEMQSRLKLSLIADGQALKNIVDWIYSNIQSFWDYLKSVVGISDGDAKSETNVFFSAMGKWFRDAVSLFESMAHKIMNGILQIVEAVQRLLYEAGKKAIEYLYGSMEVLFKTSKDVEVERSITNMGFYFMTSLSHMMECIDENIVFSTVLTTTLAKKTQSFNKDVISLLQSHQSSFDSKESWLLKDVSFEQTVVYLNWLTILIENMKSFYHSIFATLSFVGPLLNTLFGKQFENISNIKPFVRPSLFQLNKLKENVEKLKNSPDMPGDQKDRLDQSLFLIQLTKDKLAGQKTEFRKEYYENPDTFNTNLADLFTSAYYDDEPNVELLNRLLTSKTGFDVSQLYFFTQIVSESVSVNIIIAQTAALRQKIIGNGLTEAEKTELQTMLRKDWKDFTEKEQSRLSELLDKQRDPSRKPLFDIFENELSEYDKEEILRLKKESESTIEAAMNEKKLEIAREIEAIEEIELQYNIERNARMKSAISSFVKLRAQAEKEGRIVSESDVANSTLTVDAYQLILNNAIMADYAQKWQKVYNLRKVYNAYLIALNLKMEPIKRKKRNYYFLTGALVIFIPLFFLIWYITQQMDVEAADIFTRKTVTTYEEVTTVKKDGWLSSLTTVDLKPVTQLVKDELIPPGVKDIFDFPKLLGYFKQATEGSILTPLRYVRYSQLLSMMVGLGPGLHSVFLFTWFFLSTITFMAIDYRAGGTHWQSRDMVKTFDALKLSGVMTLERVLMSFGAMFMVQLSASYDSLHYAGVGLSLLGSFASFSPFSIASGVLGAGKDVITITKKRIEEAGAKRFSFADLFVSNTIREVIFPQEELKQLEKKHDPLTMVELLDIQITSPLVAATILKLKGGSKTPLLEDKPPKTNGPKLLQEPESDSE